MNGNSVDSGRLDRRTFLRGSALAAAATAAGGVAAPCFASGVVSTAKAAETLIASAPVLQNAAETSIGVSFAVRADASGWVEYATRADFSDVKRAYSGGHGLMDVSDCVSLVRLMGLKPATRYHYRIGADRISYRNGYAMRNLGSEVDSSVHSFTTLGASIAAPSFCVINDTHDQKPVLDLVFSKIAAIRPSVVVWNGDASNTSEDFETAAGIFLHPHPNHLSYAADTPYIFINGNHDFRGRFNRHLETLMMYRESAERASEYAELGRNFVQRIGDIALIGLDTGEDKLDTNPVFAGIFRMKPYRELQAKWLAEVVQSPAVRTSKFKVAFCHIPLFDADPTANPGDVAPADADPKYTHNYARWQRTCAGLWGPSLAKAGVQLVVTGHQHRFRYDAPTGNRPWAQIVGGGPHFDKSRKAQFPTVVEGRVVDGKLRVTVHDVLHGTVAGEYAFA